MNYKALSAIVILVSLIISSLAWEIINFPKMTNSSIRLFDNVDILNNPINDPLRFIVFIAIPLLSIVFLVQKKDKIFFKNFLQLAYFNDKSAINRNKENNSGINFFTYFIFFVIIVEFLFIDFSKFNHLVDFFHEGMWLSASQNLKLTGDYWTSSFIIRGLFADFYPFFLWEIFNKESIGITRLFQLIVFLLNKILILLIIRKIAIFSNLRGNIQILFFLSTIILSLSIQGYINPIFLVRSFLFLLFILIFLNFLQNCNLKFFYLIILGLFSSISFFWYIDIGVYINLLLILILFVFAIKLNLKNFLILLLSTLFGWIMFFLIIPNNEFNEFIKNTLTILGTLGWFHGLDFPHPFLELHGRALKSILLFLVSGYLLILLINSQSEKNKLFNQSMIFMYFASIIYFNYALGRSDGGHIRVGSGVIQIVFFVTVLFFIVNLTSNFLRTRKSLIKKLNIFLVIFFTSTTLFLDKKYENKSFNNLLNVRASIVKLVNYDDTKYLNENYSEFFQYYSELINKEECATVFTNEAAIFYFIKKQSCSKYYFMWSSSPVVIQQEIIKDFEYKSPKYIVYKSDIDNFSISDAVLTRVKNYIDYNYKFHEKIKYWEIYKRK